MSGLPKGVVGFLLWRPLIALVIAAVVVGVLLLDSHRQEAPVTHRVEHVGLTDKQQVQLGNEEYTKELRQDRVLPASSRSSRRTRKTRTQVNRTTLGSHKKLPVERR
jgi:hypothetical protein